MNLSDQEFAQAAEIADEIIDFVWDDKSNEISALACLMAAVPYILDSGHSTGDACRILKILMKSYGANNGTEKH